MMNKVGNATVLCFGKLTGLHWSRGARADDIHIGVTLWSDNVTYIYLFMVCVYNINWSDWISQITN